jgi:hypothetical protein
MSELFGGNPDQANINSEQAPAPQESAPPQAQPAPVDSYAHQLASITAEDGRQKYADVSTALASIPHAQQHIKQLTEELNEAKEQLDKTRGVDEVLQQLQTSQDTNTETPPVAGLDENAIAALVDQRLTAQQQQVIAQQNAAKVRGALTEVYGDKAEEVFKNRAAELGLSVEYLESQALAHPDFVLKQFDMKQVSAAQPTSQSSISTSAMQPQQEMPKPVMRGASSKDIVAAYKQMANS